MRSSGYGIRQKTGAMIVFSWYTLLRIEPARTRMAHLYSFEHYCLFIQNHFRTQQAARRARSFHRRAQIFHIQWNRLPTSDAFPLVMAEGESWSKRFIQLSLSSFAGVCDSLTEQIIVSSSCAMPDCTGLLKFYEANDLQNLVC